MDVLIDIVIQRLFKVSEPQVSLEQISFKLPLKIIIKHSEDK